MTEQVQAVRPKISHALVDKLIGKEYIRIYHCGVCGASVGLSEESCKVCRIAVDWNGVKQPENGRKRKRMVEIKIADEHPMILQQRAAMRAVHRELNEAKECGQKYRVSDLETKLRRMRKDLKEAYENLRKAGWK